MNPTLQEVEETRRSRKFNRLFKEKFGAAPKFEKGAR